LNTNKPVAGEVTGLAAFVAVKAILGGKNPLSVANTSNFAEAFGVVVPIPVWAFPLRKNKNNISTSTPFLIFTMLSIRIRL
jgi:hypothetical protein